MAFMKAALGLRAAVFLAGAFLAAAFFTGAALIVLTGVDFFAAAFLAGAFLAGAFFAVTIWNLLEVEVRRKRIAFAAVLDGHLIENVRSTATAPVDLLRGMLLPVFGVGRCVVPDRVGARLATTAITNRVKITEPNRKENGRFLL